MRSEDKIRAGARPWLAEGEEVLAAFVARPRGWTQGVAGSIHVGAGQQGVAHAAAKAASFRLGSPMALAITDRRLLSLSMGAQVGMGVGGGVKDLLAQAPLSAVDAIEVKRLLVGKVVTVTIRGSSFNLEVGAGANTRGVVTAFEERHIAAGRT